MRYEKFAAARVREQADRWDAKRGRWRHEKVLPWKGRIAIALVLVAYAVIALMIGGVVIWGATAQRGL